MLYRTEGQISTASRRLIVPEEVTRMLERARRPYVNPDRFGTVGFDQFRGIAQVIARVLRSRPNFLAEALELTEGTPLPELGPPPAETGTPRRSGSSGSPLDGVHEEPALPSPARPATEPGDMSPTEEGDTSLLDEEEEREALEARERAREKAEAEAKLLRYLQGSADPREAARRVLFLAKEGESDFRAWLRVAARAGLTLQFHASLSTAAADAGYARDLAWGATEDEAFERHRSRMKSWANAVRSGQEIREEENIRKPGTKPTMNRAGGDYRRRLEWEWEQLDHEDVLEEEWRKAASLARLLDMVRCRKLNIVPMQRRPVPPPTVGQNRAR
jgi:hypothetical protein